MVKNTCGGNKHKRSKNKVVVEKTDNKHIDIADPTCQTYGLIKKRWGGSRMEIECADGKVRSGIIRGKMLKRVWLNFGDIVLCDLNATGSDSDCSIVMKYTPHQVNRLKELGEINFDRDDTTSNCEFESLPSVIKPQNHNVTTINQLSSSDSDSDNHDNHDNHNNHDNHDYDQVINLDDI
jgi:translation initiation factor 1A